MRALGTVIAAGAGLLVSLTDASTLTPPVLPLIVRNPYLSTWLANARDVPWSNWPMFYTGQEIGFSVLASVPDSATVYPLLGRAYDSLDNHGIHYNLSFPTYLGAQYDASTTNLTYEIPTPKSPYGRPLELTLSFLSPITPTSTLRQAIPAAYLSVYVKGNFDVDFYIDVNGQWVSGNRGSEIVWSLEETNHGDAKKLKTWKVKRRTEQILTEWNDRAEWGTLHFTGPSDVRHECGTSALLRQQFAKNGVLQNKLDNNYRAIMDEEPVFAFSKSFNLSSNHTDLHSSSREDSALFTINHLQDPVTQFASSRGLTLMRPLWMSYFYSDSALVEYHYTDFEHASALAANYSAQLALDAYASGSDNYKDIVALSARQVMGATSFSGTPENPILFLKEISSNGNSQTVDVIFPSFPFFLYTNPRWLAYLLEPLLEHMLSGQYPNKYTMHDLGYHFPNLTGHADGRDEYMPVEECGDMLIMGLALVNSLSHGEGQKSGSLWAAEGGTKIAHTFDLKADQPDGLSAFPLPQALETRDGILGLDGGWGGGATGSKQARSWLKRSYPLWKQWTSYLVDYSLMPHNQLCTDDFAGWLALQTNLALKGIIGIKAMSELAGVMDEKDDAEYYRNVSEVYVKKWEELAMARDGGRAKLAYDWYGSWTTLYSLYADALLCFHPNNLTSASSPSPVHMRGQEPLLPNKDEKDDGNFIPDHVYTTQSSWYTTTMQKYGLPLDSRHLYTKSDWEFQAAAVASRETRAMILDRVARWLNETETDRPFSDLYRTEGNGGFPGPNFFARPVVGSHFAFLTLERACGGAGAGPFGYSG